MAPELCIRCRVLLRARYHQRISLLKQVRDGSLIRRYATSPASSGSSNLSLYVDTVPPTSDQLRAAAHFFRTYPPRKLWTAMEWRTQNVESGSLVPEIAFLGRSNVGKSSLLNAVLATPGLNRVGALPGKTKVMHAWALSARDPKTGGALKGFGGDMENKLTVIDMPGYGYASRDEWGAEIIKYMERRKHLRKVFVLLDASHGAKPDDIKLLRLLRSKGLPHSAIVSKIDRLQGQAEQKASMDALFQIMNPPNDRDATLALRELIAVGGLGDTRSNKLSGSESPQGVAEVQYAILRAAGLEELAIRNATRDKLIGQSPPTTWTMAAIDEALARLRKARGTTWEDRVPVEEPLTPTQDKTESLRRGLSEPTKNDNTEDIWKSVFDEFIGARHAMARRSANNHTLEMDEFDSDMSDVRSPPTSRAQRTIAESFSEVPNSGSGQVSKRQPSSRPAFNESSRRPESRFEPSSALASTSFGSNTTTSRSQPTNPPVSNRTNPSAEPSISSSPPPRFRPSSVRQQHVRPIEAVPSTPAALNSPASQVPTSPLSGKAVGQGLDALLAMTGTDTKTKKPARAAKGKQTQAARWQKAKKW